jgi:acetyl esterase/lipase
VPARRLLPLLAIFIALSALSGSPATARPKAMKPNTGKAGSPCRAAPLKEADPGRAADLDSTSLGRATPALYEIGRPTSDPERHEPTRRVMILVHGGGWAFVGRTAMRSERRAATKWRAAGWETVSITYRACRRSVTDVTRFYDLIRARVGSNVPICLRGQSAGGHLALMVAAKRRDVACVISLASPTDLRSIRAQGRIEAASGGPAELPAAATRVRNLAVAAFGRRKLRVRSPAALASRIGARLLLATAVDDVVIPQGQAASLANAVKVARPGAYVDVVRVERGAGTFVHGSASAAASRDFDSRAAALVAPFGRAPLDAGPPLEPRPPSNPLGSLFQSFLGIFGARR